MRLFLAIVALWLLGSASALAQSEDWLILPTTESDDATWMGPTASEVSRELRRQGVGVWSSTQALLAFEKRGSAPPIVVAPDEVKEWEARSQAAVRKLAQGDYERALAELEEAGALSRSSLEGLNRDPERARTVLDTCLYMVRTLLETGDESGARSQAEDCVRMVPGAEPTRYMHPPRVADLYADASHLGTANRGTLLVESEPADCALRVNGVLVGRTPLERTGLYPGEYRVQVECHGDLPGRVHPASVARGRTTLFVVDRFDQALRATPTLHLRYEEPPDDIQRARDARELARALPAAAVVLVSTPADLTLELRLVGGARKDAAFARIVTTATGPSAADVAKATATLLSGQCRDLSGPEPVTLDCATGQPIVAGASERGEAKGVKARPPRGQRISGLTLASVGIASLLTGYGLLIARGAVGDDWISDPGDLDLHNKWLNLGTGVIATGSAGAATLVAAMPLALPYKSKTPWWGWLSGGLGIGFAGASIALAVTADAKPATSCTVNTLNAEPCVNRGRRTDLAIMLGASAAPLLTVPLVYLLRKDDKKLEAQLTPGVLVNQDGAAVLVRGLF